MPKLRKCAYCKKEVKLTREHIWPSCLITRMPELQVNYLKNNRLFTAGDLVIADVCAACNNIKLSPLDAYFCSLYDGYFKTYKEDLTPFKFEYDYNLLLRSLLKITYNSSRTVNREYNDFEKYREFILTGNGIHQEILIKLDIVQPAMVKGKKFYPSSARCGEIQIGGPTPNFLLRLIAVNSFYFYIVISKSAVLRSDMEEEFNRIFDNLQGTIIHPYKQGVIVDTFSDVDTLNSHGDFLASTQELYFEYVAKKKR
ncbi:hypothetical protein [Mucilaginibacter paludis]|uniref:HNH endonuclease 5 domain-containing protein n=1 Tax=Mucilaginibacter paludis DSM 18603 TaxID=714943 RepID=H1Y176_9SPHI|nr:hypothetical protein [Mucilaginibacter paludis]EHQ29711.1 hypothetical protein Mucpa_5642 [Mucilaginibacter paludis DSM 18603]